MNHPPVDTQQSLRFIPPVVDPTSPPSPPAPARDALELWQLPWTYQPHVLGLEGRVSPIPGRPTGRAPGTQPPDTALEGFDLGVEVQVRGTSVRGHAHRLDGSVRQDAMAAAIVNGWLLTAVADGLGSEPCSHDGALTAALAATSGAGARQFLADASSGVVDWGLIRDALLVRACELGCSPGALRTTLTVAALPLAGPHPYRGWVAELGDSPSWLLRDRVLNPVFPVESGPVASSAVQPLPDVVTARVRPCELRPGDTLLLTSDGVGNLLARPNPYRDHLAQLLGRGAPTPAALLTLLDTPVRSHDDDRTCLLIRRSA